MTTFNTRLIPAALAMALFLPACGDSDSSADSGDGMDAASIEESVEGAFDSEPIPSQDVADAAAEAEIDESNADDAMADLKAEIDG